jgi:hypothetical protein
MKKSTESNCDYLDRLKSERGEAASRDAIRSYRQAHGIKGMGSIQDQLSALEAAPVTAPRPLPSAPVSSQPAMPAPRIASAASLPSPATSSSQPELRGKDRVRASILAGFAKERSSVSASLPKTTFAATQPEAPRKADEAASELTGRNRLQAGIHSQLQKQKENGTLPKVSLSPASSLEK